MKKLNYIVLSTAIILFTGCTKTNNPAMELEPPEYVEMSKSKINEKYSNTGSLFGQGRNPLFSDRKAMNVNDILTILINENVLSNSKAQKNTNHTTDLNMGGGLFNGGATGLPAPTLLNKVNQMTNMGFETKTTNNFTAGGDQKRTESFQASVTARIIKVLSNGNYYISGSKELLIDGEKQIIQIAGVIRPDDINKDNTIASKYIADAKIHYATEGEIKKATEKGWGSKALENAWPF